MSETLPEIRVRLTRLKRSDGLLALLGWVYLAEAFAWHEGEERWRPAPFVYDDCLLVGWRRRFRKGTVEDVAWMVQDIVTRHHEAQREQRWVP